MTWNDPKHHLIKMLDAQNYNLSKLNYGWNAYVYSYYITPQFVSALDCLGRDFDFSSSVFREACNHWGSSGHPSFYIYPKNCAHDFPYIAFCWSTVQVDNSHNLLDFINDMEQATCNWLSVKQSKYQPVRNADLNISMAERVMCFAVFFCNSSLEPYFARCLRWPEAIMRLFQC